MKSILLGCLLLAMGIIILIDKPDFNDYGQYATVFFIIGLGGLYLDIDEHFEIHSPVILKIMKIGLIMLIFGFAIYSLLVNNMPIPTRYGPFRFHGLALWMMCCAIISAFLPMLSNVFTNKKFQSITKYSGEAFLIFLILSLYSGIYMAVKST